MNPGESAYQIWKSSSTEPDFRDLDASQTGGNDTAGFEEGRILRLPTSIAWVIGRTLVLNDADLDTAYQLTLNYTVTPLQAAGTSESGDPALYRFAPRHSPGSPLARHHYGNEYTVSRIFYTSYNTCSHHLWRPEVMLMHVTDVTSCSFHILHSRPSYHPRIAPDV